MLLLSTMLPHWYIYAYLHNGMHASKLRNYSINLYYSLSQVVTLKKSTNPAASLNELRRKTCSLSGSDEIVRSSVTSAFPIPTVYTITPSPFSTLDGVATLSCERPSACKYSIR